MCDSNSTLGQTRESLIKLAIARGIVPGATIQCAVRPTDQAVVPSTDKWFIDYDLAPDLRFCTDEGTPMVIVTKLTKYTLSLTDARWARVIAREGDLFTLSSRQLEALAASAPSTREQINDMLPGVLAPPPPEYFTFEHTLELSTTSFNTPLLIAKGLAPQGHELKCLKVNGNYTAKVVDSPRGQFIYLIKQQS